MAKTNETADIDLRALLSDLRDVLTRHLAPFDVETTEPEPEPAAKPKRGSKKKPDPEPEPETDDNETDDEPEADEPTGRAALLAKTIAELRALAKEHGIGPSKTKGLDRDALADLIEEAIEDETGESTSDDDTDDDETDGETDRRTELEAMTEKALRKVAVGLGFDKEDVAEADKETLVDSILADEADDSDDDDESDADEDDETDEESDDESEDDDDDDADEPADDEDDDEGYTKAALEEMSLADLKEIAEAWEIKVRAGAKQATYIKAILAEQDGPNY